VLLGGAGGHLSIRQPKIGAEREEDSVRGGRGSVAVRLIGYRRSKHRSVVAAVVAIALESSLHRGAVGVLPALLPKNEVLGAKRRQSQLRKLIIDGGAGLEYFRRLQSAVLERGKEQAKLTTSHR
jgi:hypothetical protein